MSVSRRGFLGSLLAARGNEAHLAEAEQNGRAARPTLPAGVHEVRINSNENPLGPGQTVLDAIVGKFSNAGSYPFNASPGEGEIVAAVADKFKIKRENIVMGAGSQEMLTCAVRAFTTPTRGLVTAAPSFEACPTMVKKLGHPITEIRVDSAYRLDLEPMLAASKNAGLVFFNNPNNPPATVHGAKTFADFVQRVRKASPATVILIHEAYHDYVADPAYQTAVPLALETPNVLVTRTFSKARHGRHARRLRIGRAETMSKIARLKMPYVSVLGIAAAIAALHDQKHIDEEAARNNEVRAFTIKALKDLGFTPASSQANFLFVDIQRPAKEFRDGCAKAGVYVGRDFPPFEKTHARISIGTMDEMVRATEVFRQVLRPATTSSSGKGQ